MNLENFEPVIKQLSGDVANAEKARQERDHQEVDNIYNNWLGNSRYLELLDQIGGLNEHLNIEPYKNTLAIGFIGLGRIKHVDANTRLKRAAADDRPPILQEVYSVIHGPYLDINVRELPPFTIHGGNINWFGETSQDEFNTAYIIGDYGWARRVAHEAIETLKEDLASLNDIITNVPERILRVNNYPEYVRRKKFIGNYSSLGILVMREAMLNRHLPSLNEGFSYVFTADKMDPNPERLALTSLWSLESSFTLPGNLKERFTAVRNGVRGIVRVSEKDMGTVIKAYKQHLQERA